MKIELLHYTPITIGSDAIRTCWASNDKSDSDDSLGAKDKQLMERVVNKFKHESTIEHISYNFHIEGITRACLQELARHRISSFSVKSSRYTLRELKGLKIDSREDAEKYVRFTGNHAVDSAIMIALQNLIDLVNQGISNDVLKYAMPEAYLTELAWTINARSLKNFLSLRTDKAALQEIRELAHAVYESLPDDHKFLFEKHIKEKDG